MTNPQKKREREIYKVTITGSIVSLLLVLIKFPVGIFTKSSAMIADALHSLSDLATDIVLILFIKTSQAPKDEAHNYGHGKFETLASLIIGLVLLGVGVLIAWNGATSIYNVIQGGGLPNQEIFERFGYIALIAALVTLVSKEILYRYTVVKGKKLNSPALVANAWHHRSDALSSIGTAAGIGGAFFLGGKWVVLDPIAAVIVSIFIVKMAVKLIKPNLDEFLERSLPEEVQNEIGAIVNSFEDVHDFHNLRTRKIGNYYAIDFHIKMDGNKSLTEIHAVSDKIEAKLKERYGSETFVTIHIDPI
jgi:cation diffusion facilitator family transporter